MNGGDFEDVTDLVRGYAAEPGTAEAVAGIREEMERADRAHAMSLAMVRRAAGLTQSDIARSLGVSQSAVARTEGREDMLLSTLVAYLEAAGATAVIRVRLADGRTTDVSLDEAAAAGGPA